MAPERSGLTGRLRTVGVATEERLAGGGSTAAGAAETPVAQGEALGEAPEMAETLESPEVKESPDAPRIDDPRYPRGRWFRALRMVALRAYLVMLAYPLAVVTQLVAIVALHGLASLRLSTTYLDASLLPGAVALVAAFPLAAGVPILLLVDLVVLRRLARRDVRQEEAVLQERLFDERLTQTRIAVVTAPLSSRGPRRAAAAGAPPAERMPHQPAPGEPHAPPDDLALLPEPAVFVGRASELAWLDERLGQRGLLALSDATGIGGVGVRSLLAHAVRRAREAGRFADGIALLDCTGRRDGHELLRVALARFDPGRRQPEALDVVGLRQAAQTLLGGKDVLVVLEGIEPGLSVAEITRPLLAAEATIVLTARGYLEHVSHEATLLIGRPPLDEALTLFTRAYEQAGSGAAVEPKPALAERIVNALARHPLAVTLVAVSAAEEQRLLSAVADALQGDPRGGLGLDTDDVASAAALGLDMALGRLGEATLRLFTAFGAFSTRQVGRGALLATAGAFGVERPSEQLRRLARRDVVAEWSDERLTGEEDRERLSLHPLVYALARQRFAALPEGEQSGIRFVLTTHYAQAIATASDDAIARDEPEILAALEWAHRNAQTGPEALICDRMRHYWRDRRQFRAGLQYLPWGVVAAAARASMTGDQADRQRAADVALSSGEMLRAAGKLGEAEEVFRQNLSIRRELGEQHGAGLVLVALGELAQERDRLDEAATYFQEALVALHAAGADRDVAICQAWLGRVALRQNRLDAAESSYREALALDQQAGDRQGAALDLAGLGQIALRRGNLAEAEQVYTQAVGLRQGVGDRRGEAMDLHQLGMVAQQRGALDEAEGFYNASLQIRRDVLDRQGEGITLAQLGRVAAHREALDDAEAYFTQSLDVLLELQDAPNYAAVALRAGQFFLEQRGKREEGATLLHQAIELYRQMGQADELARAHEVARRFDVE